VNLKENVLLKMGVMGNPKQQKSGVLISLLNAIGIA
jgi:hypothetical protein